MIIKYNTKDICIPIKNIIELFAKHCFTIEKEELSDFHFDEFSVVMKGRRSNFPKKINIEDIEIYSEYVYICKYHW